MNILFIIGDQWRAAAAGYEGNPDVQTPNLDALARESLRMNHCISNVPVCCPWRASMLTGMYPDRHGVFLNDGILSSDAHTFGEHFSGAGYDTAWIGKWHVDGHGRTRPIPRERQHGFQYWRALECTHDYNHSVYYAGNETEPRIWPGYDAFSQTEDLIAWMADRNGSRPFLAFLSWGPPHNPYHTAPDEFKALYRPESLTLSANVPEEAREQAARDLAGYYAHCSALDECMGRILRALEEQGLKDRTLVIFTSDHGDMLGSHGLWEKNGPWEPALRTPMLLRHPAEPGLAGSASDVLFSMVDFLPTLCGMVGVQPPPEIQGRDLSSHLLQGTLPDPNDALYASYFPFGTWLGQDGKVDALYRSREARGLRTLRHTYVEDLNGPWLLYDNSADPDQMINRCNDPSFCEVQTALAKRLYQRLAELDDPFPPGREYVERFYPGLPLGRLNSLFYEPQGGAVSRSFKKVKRSASASSDRIEGAIS